MKWEHKALFSDIKRIYWMIGTGRRSTSHLIKQDSAFTMCLVNTKNKGEVLSAGNTGISCLDCAGIQQRMGIKG